MFLLCAFLDEMGIGEVPGTCDRFAFNLKFSEADPTVLEEMRMEENLWTEIKRDAPGLRLVKRDTVGMKDRIDVLTAVTWEEWNLTVSQKKFQTIIRVGDFMSE